MEVISDANILSSLAAADALDLLIELFPDGTVYIPPAVEQELQVALQYGKTHVKRVVQALKNREIERIELTEAERMLISTLPTNLQASKQESIAICQTRKHLFLSNHRRAIRYCEANDIQVVNLSLLLRALWTRDILFQAQVKELIETMATVEKLTLKQSQHDLIFAPLPSPPPSPRRRHHRRHRRRHR